MRSRRASTGCSAIKGVIEVVEPESDEAEDKAARAAAAAAFEQALADLVEMRQRERRDARADPARSAWTRSRAWRRRPRPRPAASPTRSGHGSPSRSRHCSNPSDRFDPDRLNQEAIHDRGQGRYPRRTGPDRLAYRAGPRDDRQGRSGRTAARFPGAGIQPRGQYLLLQVERSRT